MSIRFDKSDPDEIFRSEEHNEEVYRREKNEEDAAKKKMPAAKLPNIKPKYINNIGIDPDAFKILSGIASNKGDRMDSFCAKILEAVALNPDFFLKSKEYRQEVLEYRVRKLIDQQMTVRVAAAEYNSIPNADLSSIIVEMCDELGIDPEKIKSDAKDDPMSGTISEYKNNPTSKRARCKKWIVDYMKKHDFKVKASTANADAMKAGGFGKEVTAHAKAAYGIISTNEKTDGGEYYWVWPDKMRAAKSILEGY